MSIFYEYDETIGGFEHDPNGDVDVRNPNSEDDHYEEDDYQEFNHVGDDYVEITREFSSIFHDETTLECVVYEGKHGPDHPESLGMRTVEDMVSKKKKSKENTSGVRDGNYYTYTPKDRNNQREKDLILGHNLTDKELEATHRRKFRHDGKTKYIPGSDKDKSATLAHNNAEKHKKSSEDDKAAIGSAYRRSSAGKGHKSGISDRERENLRDKKKKESKEIRTREFHKAVESQNAAAILSSDFELL